MDAATAAADKGLTNMDDLPLYIIKRDDAIAACCAFIGRTVTSSKQMTVAEASKVIDGLDKLEAGLIELVANDDGTLTVKDAA